MSFEAFLISSPFSGPLGKKTGVGIRPLDDRAQPAAHAANMFMHSPGGRDGFTGRAAGAPPV